eukprot:m.93714 g.93714  ORF g.93714 m.93714 type:complete len:91 (-) comp14989_c0_seq24:148-420(-)
MPAQDIHPRHVRNRLENDSCRASVCLGDGGAAETGRVQSAVGFNVLCWCCQETESSLQQTNDLLRLGRSQDYVDVDIDEVRVNDTQCTWQ